MNKNIVTVHFGNAARTYNYWAPLYPITPKVIVDTPYDGYQIVDVVETRKAVGNEADNLKRIVCLVHDDDYKKWAASTPATSSLDADVEEDEDDPEVEEDEDEDLDDEDEDSAA